MNWEQSQLTSGSGLSMSQVPHAANPAASSGSTWGQVFESEYANTSNPGAAMSKCGPAPHRGLTSGQKFVPFRTIVVVTPAYPGALLVPVTFQHFPHPSAIQFPPPRLEDIAAAP